MTLTLTSELAAVNTMLSTIGEAPINSLSNITQAADAVTARAILQEISVEVQTAGWYFNTDKNLLLTPSLTGEIALPNNCVECDTTGASSTTQVSVREGKLYDNQNHTFVFDKPLYVDMVLLLEYEKLPQAARYYILIRASRVFQRRVLGSITLDGFSEKDELLAKITLRKFEARTSDRNILSGSYSVSNTLRR